MSTRAVPKPMPKPRAALPSAFMGVAGIVCPKELCVTSTKSDYPYIKRDISYWKRDLSYIKRDLSFMKRDELYMKYPWKRPTRHQKENNHTWKELYYTEHYWVTKRAVCNIHEKRPTTHQKRRIIYIKRDLSYMNCGDPAFMGIVDSVHSKKNPM